MVTLGLCLGATSLVALSFESPGVSAACFGLAALSFYFA